MAAERRCAFAISGAQKEVIDAAGISDVPGPRDQANRGYGDREIAHPDPKVRRATRNCVPTASAKPGRYATVIVRASNVSPRNRPKATAQPVRRSPSVRTRAHNGAVIHAVAGRAK